MKPQDELWWAHLDGELPPAETARLDASLSAADRNRMSGERQFEQGLGEALAKPVPGADQAWLAALAKVKAQEKEERGRIRRRRSLTWITAPLAVAAMALVMLSTGYFRSETPQPWFLKINPPDKAAQVSPVQAQEVRATARTMLRDRAMHMDFDPKNSLEAADSPYRLVSVRDGEYHGEKVLELTFDCGAEPAKVIITNSDGNAAREITRAAGSGAVHASRPVGNWLISVVGTNAPDSLLSLLEEEPPVPDGSPTPVEELPQAGASAPIATGEPAATPVPETAPEPAQAAPEAPIQPEQPSPQPNSGPEPTKTDTQPPPLA